MGAFRSLFARIDAGYIVTLLLTIFSGVYLTKIGVSPIYGTSVLGVAALVSWTLAARGAAPLSLWAQSFGIVLLMIPVAIYQASLEGGAGNVVNFVLGPILAALIPISGRRLDKQQLVSIARLFVLCTFAVTTVEGAWRLTHPDLSFLEDASQHRDDVEDIAFYAYKFNSLMYIDSNFVGLQLAVLFAFLMALTRKGVHVPRTWYVYTFLLTIGTLSRASIFACLFLVGIEGYRRLAKGPAFKFVVAFAMGCAAVGAFYLVQNDESFATKFDILRRFVHYVGSANLSDLLFGVGVGHAVHMLGIGAHNLVVTYVVEIGLVLTVVVLIYWLRFAVAVPVVGYLVAAWLVNGFSLTTFAIPYMYASAAILMLLHRLEPHPAAPMVPVLAGPVPGVHARPEAG
jgi:hypothetical protein